MNTKPFASKNAALKSILGLAISLAVLAIAVGSASAGCIGVDTGTDYGCGDTAMESCIFNENLICPAGVHGLEVGADDITIDCYNATLGEYFKIMGSENAAACECPDEAAPEEADCGIYNYKHDNVVIKNLEVENFCHGILLKGTAENKVVNNTIESCKVYDNGNESTDCLNHGILLIYTRNSKVDNNEVYNNTGEVTTACSTGGHGIKLFKFSSYNSITNNTIYGNAVAGIYAKKECMYNYAAYNELYENGKFVGGPAEIGCVAHDGTVYKCGDMVVQSCTFNGDMSCPSGHGLEIGEDRIVIDGNEYCIDGFSPGDTYRAGIYNYGYDSVVIKNLEVKNFCDGIRLKSIYDSDMDICTNKVENNTIDNCEVHDNGASDKKCHGIELRPCVCNSTIINCTVYDNTGKVEGSCEDGGMGIRLHTRCDHNNITNNTIYGNRLSGIFSKMKCMHNYVAYNDVYENGHVYEGSYFGGGIRLMCLFTNFWTVEHNTVTDNIGPGILVGGKRNIVRCNNVTGSKNGGTGWGSGHGINICRNSEGNTLILNNCSENEADGIAITSGQAMLEENAACDNGGYDIHVYDYAAAIGDNNTCDTTYGYDDEGTTGCTYPCAPVEIGCVAEDGTVYKCGDMVVQSCTFNGDMSCPSGHGLEIGEDGIVIDGDGYCIDGVSPGDSYRAGIYNYKYDNVVIKNLEVKNFCDGIRLKGRLEEGECIQTVENNTIDNCEVHDNGKSDRLCYGIHLRPCVCHSTITNCVVYNTTGAVSGGCEDAGMGIRLHTMCNYNNITNNKIYGNLLSGIFSKMKCMHNYVAYNDVYENGHVYAGNYFGGGIRLECIKTNYWLVEHNNVTDNFGPGIYVRGCNNIVRYNDESGSKNAGSKASGSAVSVGYGMYYSPDANGNNITANEFCENEGVDIRDDGIGNSGDENTCDTTEKYDDEGTTGCTYLCSAITAAFSADQTKGTAPLTVNFTDESRIAEGEIVSWKWNFGDGGTSSEQNPAHVYETRDGAYYSYYNVSLTVNETGGDSDTVTKTEYIKVWKPESAPNADFSGSPRKMGISPMTVDFTDKSLGDIESWFWDFGDGATSNEQNPTHTYGEGVHTVGLTVTGPGGSTRDTKADYIVVNRPDSLPAQIDAHFFASSRSGTPPLEVAFTDMSRSEGDIDSWLWDFGDGSISTERNPTHTYSSAGTYTVSLEVTAGDAKAKETKTDYIKSQFQNPKRG